MLSLNVSGYCKGVTKVNKSTFVIILKDEITWSYYMHYFHPQSAILYDTETEEKIRWTTDRWAPVVVTVRIFKMCFMFLSLCLNWYNSSLRHSKSTTRHLNIFSIGLAKADNS